MYSATFPTWSTTTGKSTEWTSPIMLLPNIQPDDMQRGEKQSLEEVNRQTMKGPLWYNNSCALDSVLMLFKVIDLGQLRVDRRSDLERDALPDYQQAVLLIIGSDWTALRQRHITLMRHSISSYCRGNDLPYQHPAGGMLTVSGWWRLLAPAGRQASMTTGMAYACSSTQCDFFALKTPTKARTPQTVVQLDNTVPNSVEGCYPIQVRVQRTFDPRPQLKETSAPCPRCGTRLYVQLAILDRIAPRLVLGVGYQDSSDKNTTNDKICTGITDDLSIQYRTAKGQKLTAEYRWLAMVHRLRGSHFVTAARLDIEHKEKVHSRVRIYDGMGHSATKPWKVIRDINVEQYLEEFAEVEFTLPIYERIWSSRQ